MVKRRGVGVNLTETCRRSSNPDPNVFLLAGRYSLLDLSGLRELFPACTEHVVAAMTQQADIAATICLRSLYRFGLLASHWSVLVDAWDGTLAQVRSRLAEAEGRATPSLATRTPRKNA